MSRHNIPGRAPGYSVVVGWDVGLQTFFARVEEENPADDDSGIIAWLGGIPGEFNDPKDMVMLLDKWADLRPMLEQLEEDRACAPPPTPLQRFGARITR